MPWKSLVPDLVRALTIAPRSGRTRCQTNSCEAFEPPMISDTKPKTWLLIIQKAENWEHPKFSVSTANPGRVGLANTKLVLGTLIDKILTLPTEKCQGAERGRKGLATTE